MKDWHCCFHFRSEERDLVETGENGEGREYKSRLERGGYSLGNEGHHGKSDSPIEGCVSVTINCIVGSELGVCSFFLDSHNQSSECSCKFHLAGKWLSFGSYNMSSPSPTIPGNLVPWSLPLVV